MPFCRLCGLEIAIEKKVCEGCGKEIRFYSALVLHGSEKFPVNSKFCRFCGSRISFETLNCPYCVANLSNPAGTRVDHSLTSPSYRPTLDKKPDTTFSEPEETQGKLILEKKPQVKLSLEKKDSQISERLLLSGETLQETPGLHSFLKPLPIVGGCLVLLVFLLKFPGLGIFSEKKPAEKSAWKQTGGLVSPEISISTARKPDDRTKDGATTSGQREKEKVGPSDSSGRDKPENGMIGAAEPNAEVGVGGGEVETPKEEWGIVEAPSGLKLRETPGMNGLKMDLIPDKSRVFILRKDGPPEYFDRKNGNWYQVRFGEKTGWVFGGLVRETTTPPAEEKAKFSLQDPAIQREISSFLHSWAKSNNPQDIDRHADCYASIVDKFYQGKNFPREKIRKIKEQAYRKLLDFACSIDIREIIMESAEVANVKIEKSSQWLGSKPGISNVKEMLVLRKISGEWKIAGQFEIFPEIRKYEIAKGKFIDGESNLRAGPGKDTLLIDVPVAGTKISLIEKKEPWMRVLYGKKLGWTHKKNLELTLPEPKPSGKEKRARPAEVEQNAETPQNNIALPPARVQMESESKTEKSESSSVSTTPPLGEPPAIVSGARSVDPITELRKAALTGDHEAQFNLACSYLQGKGVEKDEGKAAHWMKKAGEAGHLRAQIVMAGMFVGGTGVRKDMREAMRWALKAAEQGDPGAQRAVGIAYINGKEGLPQNLQEGVNWLKKSAAQGNSEAREDLEKVKRALEQEVEREKRERANAAHAIKFFGSLFKRR